MTSPSELRVRLAPELSLAVLAYGTPSDFPCVAVHGWMDCAASFDAVGPALAAQGFYVLCVELPGHGHSDHRPPSSHYMPQEYAANLAEAVRALGLSRYLLCGHSLGAGLVTLVAALPGDACVGVIMLEGVGPSIRPPAEAPALFARAVAAKAHAQSRGGGSTYGSVADAVAQRLATVARYEGGQTLSAAAAEALVRRALVEVAAGEGGGWRFRHDRRIVGPYLGYWHEEQVCAFLQAIRCPVLVVTATRGWPRDAATYANRLRVLAGAAHSVEHVELPGGHHHHLDPETAPAVCTAISSWVGRALRPHIDAAQQQPSGSNEIK